MAGPARNKNLEGSRAPESRSPAPELRSPALRLHAPLNDAAQGTQMDNRSASSTHSDAIPHPAARRHARAGRAFGLQLCTVDNVVSEQRARAIVRKRAAPPFFGDAR